jgi:ACS family tartrate transporter-like MFS transporter
MRAAVACLIGCAGLIVSAFAGSSYVALAALTVASMGLFAALPAFGSIPTALFAGSTAAAVIGIISAMGHLGGATGPYVMGLLLARFHSHTVGLCGLASGLLIAGIVAWNYRDTKSLQRANRSAIGNRTMRSTDVGKR